MPHKKDTSEPSFRGVVLVLLAVVTVTLVVRSLLVDNDPVASAFVHQRPLDFSASEPASPKAHRSPHRPPHQQGSAPFHLAAAPKPIAKLSRHCLQATHNGFLTVVSYNIRSGHGPAAPHGPGDEQLALVTQAIRLWGADVVLLQEVDVNRALSGFVNMPKVLADDLGWHYAFGANVMRPGNSQYGTAILSRYPIVEQSNTPLPNRSGMQQRGLLHVVIAPHGHQISLYDTHLQNTSSSMRDAQMRAIAPILAADPLPLVLGGDLNSFPGSQVVSIARSVASDTWAEVGSGPGFTHPSTNPHSRVDYLFHRGTLYPVRADVVNGGFSDHFAVRATYEYLYTHGEVCRLG